MKIRIWGARGSIPSPIRPEDIADKLYQAIRGMPDFETGDDEAVTSYVDSLPPLLRGTAGGNTSCVEVQAGSEIFIIDAGSGIRELGFELMKGSCGRGEGRLHLFFSHPHWDHIQGFPFFIPAFIPGNHITFYSIHDLKTALEAQQNPINFPVPLSIMQADMEFVTLTVGEPFRVGEVRIKTIENAHPGRSYGYRFQDQHSSFVFASDSEYKQLDDDNYQAHIEFFRDADALIFDAQYTLREGWVKVDWGHSSAMIGVDMARAAGVKRLLLAHHDSTYSDIRLQSILDDAVAYQSQDPTLPACEIFIAYEGLALDLTPVGAVSVDWQTYEQATILRPAGVFGAEDVQQVKSHLSTLAKSGPGSHPIIDLSQVEMLTTAELKVLVDLAASNEERGLVLVAPSTKVQEVIELGGFADDFAIYPTVEVALAAMEARQALKLPGYLLQDRYQIVSCMGASPLGSMLRATDKKNQKQVAIKILDPAFSVESREQLLHHAASLTSLDHPNIVSIQTVADAGGLSYVVEDVVEGRTLQERLISSSDGISHSQALSIGQDIATALAAAHSQGVVHGDLKHSQVFLAEQGVRVGGFGLGRLDEGRQRLQVPVPHQDPHYLAPEQILGHVLDARVDFYALGVILYQLFTGQLPFQGSDEAVVQAHQEQKPRPPRELNHQISQSLEHLILKLLAKNPSDRYANAWQVVGLLASLARGEDESMPLRKLKLVRPESSLQTLGSLWAKTRSGQGCLAFVTGEEGVGKTSLIEQMAAQSQAPVILVGACSAREGSSAYQPWREILESYVAMVPPELHDRELRIPLSVVATLVPSLHQVVPDLPQPPDLEPKQAQLRLVDSVRQVIQRATESRLCLLILEDLHWVDPGSAEMLRYLGFHLPSMALMVVGTYRDTEIATDHVLAKTLRSLNTHPGYRHMPLDRMDASQVQEILTHVWDETVPPSLVHVIYEHTGGNPFYVQEIARGLSDEGLVTWTDRYWRFPDLSLMLPETVQEAVRGRLSLLDDDTQRLLSQAAVLGQIFNLNQLVVMTGLSDWDVLEGLDVAMERQLIEEADGRSTLQFSHAGIYDVVYGDLSPLRRRRFHHQAGIALERMAHPQQEGQADVLAQHFYMAEDLENGSRYCFVAGEMAQAVHANEEAVLWFQRTIELLEKRGDQEDERYISALEYQGDILNNISEYDQAIQKYESALQVLVPQTAGDEGNMRAAEIMRKQAFTYLNKGDYELALTLLQRAKSTIIDPNSIAMARIYLTTAVVIYRRGDTIMARDWCYRGLSIARNVDEKSVLAHAYRLLGNIQFDLGDVDEAVTDYKNSIQLAKELHNQMQLMQAENDLGAFYHYKGDWGSALDYYSRSLRIAEEIGHIQQRTTAINNIGEVFLNQGRFDEAAERFRSCLATWQQTGFQLGVAISYRNLAQIYLNQEDLKSALVHSESGIGVLTTMNSKDWVLADIYRIKAEVDLKLNDWEAAWQDCQKAMDLAISQEIKLVEGSALRVLGTLFIQKAQWFEAEDALLASLALAEEMGMQYEAGQTLGQLGVLYCERTDIGNEKWMQSQRYFNRALNRFSSLQAQWDEERVRSLSKKSANNHFSEIRTHSNPCWPVNLW